MKYKIILIIVASVLVILAIACVFFVLNIHNLKGKLSYNQTMMSKIENEIARAREEKEEVLKAKEKLQADTVSYLAINTKLSEEKEELNGRLKKAQKTIERKEADLQGAKQRLEEIEKSDLSAKKTEETKLAREKKELEKKIIQTLSAIKKERALYHYNLGVAYSQAKLYDEAIGEYEKSLTYDPENADAHYNLGILYESIQVDPEKAIVCYKEYLKIEPNAEDLDEVEGRIDRLSV